MVRQAFHLATTGRPGLVLLDVPKDIVDPKNPRSQMEWYWPSDDEVAASLPATAPPPRPPRMIRQAAELILAARARHLRRRGHLKARAAEDAAGAGRAVRHPRRHHAHGPGRPLPTTTASPSACRACTATTRPSRRCRRATCSSARGSRFDEIVTGKVDGFAPDAKIIHVDIDPAELARSAGPTCPSWGTAGWSSRSWCGPCATCSTAAPPSRPPGLEAEGVRLAGDVRSRTSSPSRARPSSPSSCWSGCGTPPPTTRSSPRAWASTRCGPRSTGSSTTPTPGSTRAGWAPWGSRSRPPSAPRSAGPTAWCGRSTATAASR